MRISTLVGFGLLGLLTSTGTVLAAGSGMNCGPDGFGRSGIPDWVKARRATMQARDPLPDWIRELREQTPPRHERPGLPDWVQARRDAMTTRGPAVPDWVRERRAAYAPMTTNRDASPAAGDSLPMPQRPALPGWAGRHTGMRFGPRGYAPGLPYGAPGPELAYRGAPPPHYYGTPYGAWGPMQGIGDLYGRTGFHMGMGARSSLYGRGWGYGRPWGAPWGWVPPYAYPPTAPAAVPTDAAPAAAAVTDDDSDGVLNPSDLCADTPDGTPVDAFGCPADAAIVLRGVNFRTDSAELTPESTAILDRVGATLVNHPELRVEVAGHTDADGDDAYNKDLSQRRAETVASYLSGLGVAADRMSAMGYGEEQPVADNATAAGRALNRRVELNRR